MITIFEFAALTLTTLVAATAALAFDWLLLRLAFYLMKPAAVRVSTFETPLVHGTSRLARAFFRRP